MKKRIQFIDIAKGITMFMVVLGHTSTNPELNGPNPPVLALVMYSIHMPLFFFLSGLSFSVSPLKTKEDWRYFLRKNVLTLVVPYFMWGLIYCAFSVDSIRWMLYGSWQALDKAGTLTSLWYLSCLFVARIMTEIIVSFIGNRTKLKVRYAAFVMGIIMIAIGVVLPDKPLGYPWCLNIAFVASGCILLGVGLKKPLIAMSVERIRVLLCLFLGCIAVYTVTFILRGDSISLCMMYKGQYGSGAGVVINAVSGGLAVIILSMIIKQISEFREHYYLCEVFSYIGEYTMGVFLIHKPMMQLVIMPFIEKCIGSFAPLLLIKFISAIIAMTISLGLCNVISYYIPEMIGIFSKDKIIGRKKAAEAD